MNELITAINDIIWSYVLVVALVAHCSELLMALLMLGALVLYYIILRIFQNKLIKL